MKRVAIVGFDTNLIAKDLKNLGFVIDRMRPDITVSFGGDGSALVAEQLYPGIPRLTIRHSDKCDKCNVGEGENLMGIFAKLKDGDYEVIEEMKLEGVVNGYMKHKVVGMNEINVTHAVPITALRYEVNINGRSIKDLIGDGVVIATPYGSTGYYYSITGRTFNRGIGMAFNNSKDMKTDEIMTYNHTYNMDSAISVIINRGPGLMCADNNSNMIPLNQGDVVTVRKSKDVARLIKIKGQKNKITV